ncbi:hypothetical protein [Arthrobacter sp. SDTb3-6]|uniref:hypothetical protein n=1 Tax=Arthrobacter sp. SDTb3-6 TaxID=2713571 RepID=UPI00159E33EE|nr:hypothetical protein [Arthrobacter sp. SDTb3-6]NVM97078.1 hypothetical protein [Arthrobacter sp. SDTb3-6]
MAPHRTQLHSSTFWSARRPKLPLTEGHLVLRLNDPALAFGTASAADLLNCYGRLRRALAALKGATAAQLYLALDWQPVGDAVGEPLAETSTPTLHLFFHWPGGTAPAGPLRLPAHRRMAAPGTGELDAELRGRLAGLPSSGTGATPESAVSRRALGEGPRPGDPPPGADRSWEPPGWADRPFHIEPAPPRPGEPFRGGHWTAIPRFPAPTLDRLAPAALLTLAETMQRLASHPHPGRQGLAVWATDDWGSPAPATLHIFARRHGGSSPLLAGFVAGGGLDLPVPADGQAKNDGPSPTLEK